MPPSNNYAALDDDGQYEVKLIKTVKVGRQHLRPGADVVLKGKIIKELPDGSVAAVQPVAH